MVLAHEITYINFAQNIEKENHCHFPVVETHSQPHWTFSRPSQVLGGKHLGKAVPTEEPMDTSGVI